MFKADLHAGLPQGRLGAIGAERAIPPGPVESVVAVGFLHIRRMVNPMHVRRDDDPPEHPIKGGRYPNIAVVEEGRTVEDDLEDHDRQRSHAQHKDRQGLHRG